MDKLLDELRALIADWENTADDLDGSPRAVVLCALDPFRRALARIESDAARLGALEEALMAFMNWCDAVDEPSVRETVKQALFERAHNMARAALAGTDYGALEEDWRDGVEPGNAYIPDRTPGAQGAGQPQRPEGEEVSE